MRDVTYPVLRMRDENHTSAIDEGRQKDSFQTKGVFGCPPPPAVGRAWRGAVWPATKHALTSKELVACLVSRTWIGLHQKICGKEAGPA
jgi:hypothetical protein